MRSPHCPPPRSAPLRSVADLKGLRIGVQPTARFIMDAIAAKNGIDINDLTLVNVGFDKQPLVLGEVDAIGGWITNTQALSVIGEGRVDLLVRDLGFESYANVYFATVEAAAEKIKAVENGNEPQTSPLANSN